MNIGVQLVTGALGAVAFGIIFHLNKKYLPAAAAGAFIAWGVYLVAYAQRENLFIANLLASFAAALFAELMARICRAPSTLFFMTSVVPLIPGSLLYKCMDAAAGEDYLQAGTYGWSAFVTALAIAIGMGLAWCICDLVRKVRAAMEGRMED